MDKKVLRPSVSIIVPVYNVAPYIEECLRSVMHQTYSGSMECLIVDDCSTDHSIAIAERLIAEYKGSIQFHILHHEHNRGLSAARNTGTLQAIGDYLYYLDSDDEITVDCIETLMAKVAEHPSVEMVQGNFCRHRLTGEAIYPIKDIQLPVAVNNDEVRRCYFLYRQMTVNAWNKLLKRSFIISNGISFKEGLLYEDNLWLFYMLKYLRVACFTPKITYHQKKRPNSITTCTGEKTKGYNLCLIYQDILDHLTPGHEREEFGYYASEVGKAYVKYKILVPESSDLFRQSWKLCKQYGNRKLCFILSMAHVLGKYKYGWSVWLFLVRVKHSIKVWKLKV